MTNLKTGLLAIALTTCASFTALPVVNTQTNQTNTTNVVSTKQTVSQAVYDAKQAEINDLKTQLATMETDPITASDISSLKVITENLAKGFYKDPNQVRNLTVYKADLEAKLAVYLALKSQLTNSEIELALMEVSKEIEPKAGPETNDNDFGTDEETNSTLENSTEVSGNQP